MCWRSFATGCSESWPTPNNPGANEATPQDLAGCSEPLCFRGNSDTILLFWRSPNSPIYPLTELMERFSSIPVYVLYLVYGIAIVLLVRLAPYFVTFYRIAGLTLQSSRYTPLDRLPTYLEQLFQTSIAELTTLGFQPWGAFAIDDIFGSQRSMAVLYHPRHHVAATLLVNALPDLGNPATVTFNSIFRASSGDPWLLLTLNGQKHAVIGTFPQAVVVDAYVPTLEEQFQRHLDALHTQGVETILPLASVESLRRQLEAHEHRYIEYLIGTGGLKRINGTEQYHLAWKTAIAAAVKMTQGNARAIALQRKRLARAKTLPTQPIDIPIEAEIDAFHHLQQFEQGRTRRTTKLSLLGVTLVLFALPLASLFGWRDVSIVIGVLFLHELGHLLSMQFFGYQNTSIFFLPFFGAAASGHKDDATLTEKVMVLLSGPLPGLIVGSWMAIAASSYGAQADGLSFAIILLVVINAINLLPIFPLDGGRIVNLLVFAQYPWADLLFKWGTLLVLALVWVVTRDPFVLILGILVGVNLPSSLRAAQIVTQVRRHASPDCPGASALLPSLFQAVKQAGYGTLPFAQKYLLVKTLMLQLREPPAHWVTRLTLLGVYGVCLIGGLFLTGFSIMTAWQF